jgi:hypothetical protein
MIDGFDGAEILAAAKEIPSSLRQPNERGLSRQPKPAVASRHYNNRTEVARCLSEHS